ncbi:hypothetical protein Gorai_019057, partial [Gossypium raimondii]|nr:hypothetical protein [Gossypium raimondii]
MSSFGFWKSSSTNCSSLSSTDSDGFCALFVSLQYLISTPPLFSSYFDPSLPSSLAFTSSPPLLSIARNLSNFPTIRHKAKAVPQPQDSEVSLVADAFTHFKHLLLPITDRNPYLSEGTRQAAATTAALAKNYGADITVVVIDEKQKEELPEHGTQLSSIRWRLSQGSKATAIIAEVADDLNLDLVVMSMEAIRSKHVDANLLVEFIPCPVLFLP